MTNLMLVFFPNGSNHSLAWGRKFDQKTSHFSTELGVTNRWFDRSFFRCLFMVLIKMFFFSGILVCLSHSAKEPWRRMKAKQTVWKVAFKASRVWSITNIIHFVMQGVAIYASWWSAIRRWQSWWSTGHLVERIGYFLFSLVGEFWFIMRLLFIDVLLKIIRLCLLSCS